MSTEGTSGHADADRRTWTADATDPANRAAFANIAAEMRGIEEGHRTRYDAERRCLLVKAEGGTATYELRASAVLGDGLVMISCTCPHGRRGYREAGLAGCKHAALVLRRLERAKLVHLVDGRWSITEHGTKLAPPAMVACIDCRSALPPNVNYGGRCSECESARKERGDADYDLLYQP